MSACLIFLLLQEKWKTVVVMVLVVSAPARWEENTTKEKVYKTKLDWRRREQARKALQDGEPAEEFPFPEDFGDGSTIDFTWTRTHMHLLDMIIAQTQDDCWAWALVRILQFFYNMDITVVAQRKTLSIKSLVKYVILGRKEADRAAASKKIEKRNLAVSSLRKPIDYIRDVGIERDQGTKSLFIKICLCLLVRLSSDLLLCFCFLSPNALDLKTPLSSRTARPSACRCRRAFSSQLCLLFASLIFSCSSCFVSGSGLASVIGFCRLLAKIDDSGGGLAPRGAVTRCSGAGRAGEGLLGSGIFRSLLAATKSAPISGLGGELRVGCNRGESVRFCFFVCVLLFQFEWSSMAIRWFLVCSASLSLLPPLASCSDSPT
ncbi:hypothetical protein DY000_02054738, partial [Brassica cretica]